MGTDGGETGEAAGSTNPLNRCAVRGAWGTPLRQAWPREACCMPVRAACCPLCRPHSLPSHPAPLPPLLGLTAVTRAAQPVQNQP